MRFWCIGCTKKSPNREAAAFREAKAEFLKIRREFSFEGATVTIEFKEETLAALKAKVEQAEKALLDAGEKANKLLDQAKTQIDAAYKEVMAFLEERSITVNAYLDEISARQKTQLEQLFDVFEDFYIGGNESPKETWRKMQETAAGKR